ncbi:efflux RND transporter permease subunit [Fusibacter ferrireducens]|uniref:Efflux RND transporter permease subunit n=1 Tax=Fusibacter ferrireducens TaxID=2785058 RepID=A0ABR9ZMA2_9FIRM|nr:efflux RND transporter permease subunit [Fusibacter ferrireducens]MBF4691580.1 efflux RND transporter permease subunit [Fusibacter ferrireducens]
MIKRVILNRKIMLFFVALIGLMGLYAYNVTPKQEAPDIAATTAIVTAIFPGASPSNVEALVTSKIEKALSNIEGYEACSSYSNNSVSTMVVKFKYGVDVDATWDKLRRAMVDVQSELPDEVLTIEVNTDVTETTGILIALSSDTYSYEALSNYGNEVISKLSRVDGVAKFEISGEILKQLTVEIDYQKLNALNLSFNEIKQLIQSQNIEIPSGKIEDDGSKINLTMDGTFQSLDDIGNIIIGVSSENGSVLRLKDISKIYFEDEVGLVKYRSQGQKAILITGYFEKNKNIVTIGKDVRTEIEAIKKELPDHLEFKEVVFQPEEVDDAIHNFLGNLFMGIILVIVVVLVGMGARNAVIVSLAIPLSILSTFVMMAVFHIQIHQVSITALIVALGMLVDNAIVVSDAIQHKLDAGEPKLEACVNGAKEVSIPVLTSTLTTIGAFSPFLMLNSIAGDFVKALPIIVIIALSASYLIALFVTPAMAYIFFKPSTKKVITVDQTFVYKMLNYALAHKKMALALGLACIILLGSTVWMTHVVFFPKADKDLLYIDVTADRNVDIEYTQTVTDQIEQILGNDPGVVSYTTALGGGVPKFYQTMGITTTIPSNAQIVIKVALDQTDFNKNTPYADDLQRRIDAVLIGGKATVKELESAEPIGAPINIRFFSTDQTKLKTISEQAVTSLESIEGTKNVRSDLSQKVYEFSIDIHEEQAAYLGISKYDALNEVSIALRGREASIYRSEGVESDIIVKSNLDSIEALENLAIKSSVTDHKILLKDIATVVLEPVNPTIIKYDQKYAVKVSSDVLSGYSRQEIVSLFRQQLEAKDLEGISFEFDGEGEKIKSNFGNLGISALIALLFIYAIILIQFKSYKQPFIILLTVPLASTASVFGLFITNQPLSFTALVGIISLIGIVVNNAIVLLDYINSKLAEGLDVDEACRTASVMRFRPIMLSTITTVIGLIPLVISNSELFKPMAIALMSGLLISTMLTLVFIPLVVSMVIGKE